MAEIERESDQSHQDTTCQPAVTSDGYANLSELEKEQILDLQQAILRSLLHDRSAQEIADDLCRMAERLLPNAVASVMLYDDKRERLDVMAAPNLPPVVREQFSDLRPGPGAGSCGNVLFRKTPIFVNDIPHDARWQDLRHLAETCHLQACWSVPIYKTDNQIIGTFALSSFEYRIPSDFHKKLLETGASIIGIALLRQQHMARQRLNAQIFQNSGESIIITDVHQHFVSVNPTFTRTFGFTEREVMGQTPKLLKSGHHDSNFYQKMWRRLQQAGYWQDEIWNRTKDGTIKPFLAGISVVRDEQNVISHYIAIYSDISHLKQAQAQVEFLAWHDALTRLPNRPLTKNRAELTLLAAHDNKTRLAFLLLDIDHFKHINDSMGHPQGDALIVETALRLRTCLADRDILGRQGGDEFLIVSPLTHDDERLPELLETIHRQMQIPFQIEGTHIAVNVSIGAAVYPNDGENFDALLKAADIALYRAKEGGRNTWRFYSEQMHTEAQQHIELSNGLRQGLSLQQFYLQYQPQIDLITGKLIGVEALLRWEHPVLGNIPPGHFIPIAEDNGTIVQIGAWVLHEACRQAATWQHEGLAGCRMAVNLSAVQFSHGNLIATVEHALKTSGLPASLLELELTESILMRNAEQILDTVRQLKHLGIQLSIDDFGTGYSSLSYLKRFKVDKLKIDQSFVNSMTQNGGDIAIVRAIIQMAKGLDLKTIAEGVETPEQLSQLKTEHCDEIQGYYISRPLMPDQILRWHQQFHLDPPF